MRKIVFITGFLSDGGAERVISVLAKQLAGLEYKVEIITIYGDKNDYMNDERISIHPIVIKTNKKSINVFRRIYILRQYIKKIKPDIIVTFMAIVNLYTILSQAFLKTKLIISERNDPYQNPELKILRKIRNFLYRYADGYVFQTPDAKKYFLNKKIQKKGIVIPNPLISNLPYWKRGKTEKTLISACRLTEQKNLPMMINAFEDIKKDYPEYKLKIFGIGKLQTELQNMINKKGLNNHVILAGFSNNIHKEMANSEIFVISSNYEGISNSMLEALAIGVPVISTDSPIGGARMFISNNKNGLLTEVGNTNQFYNAIKRLLNNPKFAESLSGEAMKVREYLAPEIVANQWDEYINIIYEEDIISQSSKLS